MSEATRKALPGVHGLESDASDPTAIEALHDSVLAKFPALDVLVNNAGVMRNLDLNKTRALTDVTREIEINLSGPIRMVQPFLTLTSRARGDPFEPGRRAYLQIGALTLATLVVDAGFQVGMSKTSRSCQDSR